MIRYYVSLDEGTARWRLSMVTNTRLDDGNRQLTVLDWPFYMLRDWANDFATIAELLPEDSRQQIAGSRQELVLLMRQMMKFPTAKLRQFRRGEMFYREILAPINRLCEQVCCSHADYVPPAGHKKPKLIKGDLLKDLIVFEGIGELIDALIQQKALAKPEENG